MTDTRLILRLYKEYFQINKKKTNNPQKNRQRTQTKNSQKRLK